MQLEELWRRATGVTRSVLENARSSKLLVVVFEEFSVRGVLVRSKGKNGLELIRFLEVPFETSVTNPKLKLAHLFKAWGEIPAKRILIVTDDFTSSPAELPRPKVNRFAPHKAKDAIAAAARYEIGPFLEYPAAEAMIGVYLPSPPEDELDEFGIDESTTVQAMVFAIQEKNYQLLKQVCIHLKIKLVGVLPEEIFAFTHCNPGGNDLEACLIDEDAGGAKVVVNWRLYDALAALVIGNVPTAFLHHNFDTDEGTPNSLADLVRGIAEEDPKTAENMPMVLLGGEASEEKWEDAMKLAAPDLAVKQWNMALELPGLEAPGPVPSRYMTALSAASHVESKNGGALLVNDRVPVSVKVISHPLAMPALALIVFLMFVAADFGWWNYKVAAMETTVAELTKQKEELEKAAESESGIMSQFNSLKQQRRQIRDKIVLLNQGLPHRQHLLQAFFAGLIAETPPSIQLESIRQFSEQVWFLEGVAQRYDVVSKYVVRLKNLPMTRQCRLESSSEQSGKDEQDGLCRFSLRIRLEE